MPCTANSLLLQKILRDDWGFKGYVVSDCGAPNHLVDAHKYVSTKELAAMVSLQAGLDLECGDDIYMQPLQKAYQLGMVSKQNIDSAAYRVIRARMQLGLFDNPLHNPYNKISPSVIGSAGHKKLALEAARQSMVLLKNQGNLLPINLEQVHSIAVVGIDAANNEFGDYSGVPVGEPVSILKGIQEKVGNKTKILYAPWIPVNGLEGYEEINADFFPNGLSVAYYPNLNLEGTPNSRNEKTIHFDPASQAPDAFIPNTPVSVRWKGILRPTTTGKYNIGFLAKDGSRLTINGKLVIDSWRRKSLVSEFVDIELEAGKDYIIQADYFNYRKPAIAKLYWKAPAQLKSYTDQFADAVQKAKAAEVTIAVIGINRFFSREGQDGESIQLSKDQEVFIQQIYAANPRTVVVLVDGASLAINWINDNIPAIVDAWYGGQEGGTAVADVLFGDYNPAGRLPLTFYKSLDDLPPFGDYDITKGRTYQYFKGKPLYPFGYGLSYTKFSYSNLQVKNLDQNLLIQFTIKNIGKAAGDEVAQVYVKLPDQQIPMPIKQLKAFKRLPLNHGEAKMIQLIIDKSQLRYWDEGLSKFITPKGKYTIMVGASSEDIRLKQNVEL